MSDSITKLAQEFDITPLAIRFYEALGLLNPARGPRKVAASRRR
jgi:DNA-binding transcriptional MerR regulator